MDTIRTNNIVSGLPDNYMDWDKVEQYSIIMKQNDIENGHWGFPPITGYFGEITPDDIGDYFIYSEIDTAIQITKAHIGQMVFFVTDGHHRAFGACKAEIWCIECEKDNSGFIGRSLYI